MKIRQYVMRPFVFVQTFLMLFVFFLTFAFIGAAQGQNTLTPNDRLDFRFNSPNAVSTSNNSNFLDPDTRPVLTGMAVRNSEIFVGGDDGNVYKFSSATKAPSSISPQRGNSWVRAVAVSPNSNTLASLTQNGELKFWDVQTNKLVHSMTLANDRNATGFHDLAYSHDGKLLAICGFDQNIRILDAATYQLSRSLNTPATSSTVIRFSSDDQKLAVGGRWGVRVWDINAGRSYDITRNTLGADKMRRVRALAFSPDNTLLAIGGDFEEILVYDLNQRKLVKSIPLPIENTTDNTPQTPDGKVYSLTFCGNANLLASGDSLNRVLVWDLSSGTRLPCAEESSASSSDSSEQPLVHTGTVSTLLYTDNKQDWPNAPCLLSEGFDTTIIEWKLE